MNHFVKPLGLIIAANTAAVLLLLVLFQGANALAAGDPPPSATDEEKAPLPPIDIAGRGYWVLVANQSFTETTNGSRANSLAVINTASNAVYGPFLEGQLGSASGGVFDIALAPDGRTALVSNFGDSRVFVVDFSDPLSPSLVATVTMPMFAEDISFTDDGRFALVTDGGFSPPVASIDMLSYTLAYTNHLTGTYSNAVDAAADGTIITADYFGGKLNTLSIDAAGMITTANSYTLTYQLPGYTGTQVHHVRPVNVVVAPDNQTIIVCDSTTSTLPIYRLTAPGVLTFTGVVTGVGWLEGQEMKSTEMPRAQSVAFNEAGDHAYVLLNGYILNDVHSTALPNHLAVLDMTGPGQVRLNPAAPIPLAGQYYSSSQLFGVETLTIAGNKAFVSHPTFAGSKRSNPLQVVDLDNGITYSLVAGFEGGNVYYLPAGITTMPMRLEMTKTAGTPTPYTNSSLNYTLSLVNHGPQMTGLDLGDVLPAGLTLTGPVTIDPPTAGTVGNTAADLAHDVTIGADQQITITYSALVSPLAVGKVLTNTAWADNPSLLTQSAQAVNAVTVVPYVNYLPAILR